MIELNVNLTEIASMIKEFLSSGLIPDNDTLNFIKSGYGLNEPADISSFIENGDDSGAVIELLSYPPDNFRESVEEMIYKKGFSADEIKCIEDILCTSPVKIFVIFNETKIFLTPEDSLFCSIRFLQRLNLNLNLDYFDDLNSLADKSSVYNVRACLRKKKFITSDENYLFISDLIYNYQSVKNSSAAEFKILINVSADLLNGSDKRAMDILTEKKFFYENAISEAEEFTRMLKTYSMEFIMLKKIQPPLISSDESRSMIHIIDRLTSIVYGMIIPSAQNIILDS